VASVRATSAGSPEIDRPERGSRRPRRSAHPHVQPLRRSCRRDRCADPRPRAWNGTYTRTGSSHTSPRRSGRVGTTCVLLSGGRLDGKAGALPLGKAHIEPARLKTARTQETHCVVGVDAIGAATVGDDFAPTRKA